jgi:hypothetical protein
MGLTDEHLGECMQTATENKFVTKRLMNQSSMKSYYRIIFFKKTAEQ